MKLLRKAPGRLVDKIRHLTSSNLKTQLSLTAILFMFVGIPLSSVATGSWGQLGRFGVAPIAIFLLTFLCLGMIGSVVGTFGRIVLTRSSRPSIVLLFGIAPVCFLGTVATLVWVRHNWPNTLVGEGGTGFFLLLLQGGTAFALFTLATWAVLKFPLHGPLALFATAAMLIPYIPVQIQQGGLRSSDVDVVLESGATTQTNVLWIIPDELTASAILQPSGEIYDALPNLKRLQEQSTTYSSAVAVSVNTSQAIPAMLAGVADLRTVESSELAEIARKRGVLTAVSRAMNVHVSSPFFTTFESNPSFVERTLSQPLVALYNLFSIALDVIFSPRIEDAVTGPNGVIGRFFKDTGADFWGTDRQRDESHLQSFREIVATNHGDKPWFFVWHSLDTHSPWNIDQDGAKIFAAASGCASASNCESIKSEDASWSDFISRRFATLSVRFFDERVGQLVSELEKSGHFGKTMIVIGSDHGTAISSDGGGRHFANAQLMADGVAHTPLLIKFPGQQDPEVVNDLVSMGQIMPTVLDELGLNLTVSGFEMSTSLPRPSKLNGVTSVKAQIGIWTGYDDFWSWRSKTWQPVTKVGWYGGNDWYESGPSTTLEHLGFPFSTNDPNNEMNPLSPAEFTILEGDSPVAFAHITFDISECSSKELYLSFDSNRQIRAVVASSSSGESARAWVAGPRGEIARATIWCMAKKS
jgi:hypothetical protein